VTERALSPDDQQVAILFGQLEQWERAVRPRTADIG